MMNPRFFVQMSLVGAMFINAGAVSSQDYPNKPIRVVAATPGSGGDFVMRIVAQGISGPLGQPVIVDNRATVLGRQIVAKAPSDGYTLRVDGTSFWILPLLQEAPYNAVADFSPISLLVREVNVLAVHPSVPAKSVKELVALAKAKPGALNYGSGGAGSAGHLAVELFKAMAGVNIARVPYKGSGPSVLGLIGSEVQVVISDLGLVAPHDKSGALKSLAVTTATPSVLAPGLPTVAASGLPGYEVVGVGGLWAPAKTPVAIINRLNQEVVRVLNLAEVKERFFNAGIEVVGSSPEHFASFIKSDIAIMSKLIKDVGIKAD